MPNRLTLLHYLLQAAQVAVKRVEQGIRSVCMSLRSHIALAAEALFLQRQLDLYQDQNNISQPNLNATRFTLVWLSYWFDWEPALTIVHPQTFKRWRRQGSRLVLKTPARLERPPFHRSYKLSFDACPEKT